jgi:hypothetical protein
MKLSDEEIFDAMRVALARDRQKHPNWPADPICGAGIVAKESGDLILATPPDRHENGPGSKMNEEALDVLVAAVRFLTETPQN